MGELTNALRREPPGLHAGGTEYWGLAWEALEWLEREMRPGMATLETGSGASTLVFAASGAVHEAVTPASDEEQRFRAEAERRGIDPSSVTFRIGLSHEVLPALDPRPLDLVLIDGAHGFPFPVLDWWLVHDRIKVGGALLVDDAYIPAVNALVSNLRQMRGWEFEGAPGGRTAVFRRVAPDSPIQDAMQESWAPMFNYLSPPGRAVQSARFRLLDRGPLAGFVRSRIQRRSG